MHRPEPHAAYSTPVVFLSGALGLPQDWAGMVAHLAHRFSRIEIAETEALVAQSAGTGPCHVIAHGSAARGALGTATLHPARFRSLTLIDPDLGIETPARAAMIRRFETHCAEGDAFAATGTAVDHNCGPGTWARTAFPLQQRLAARAGRIAAAMRPPQAEHTDAPDPAGCVCPSLVLTGARAHAEIRSDYRRLHEALPLARGTLIAEAGLFAHLTDPHVVDPLVCEFLVQSERLWQGSERELRLAT